MKIQVIKNARRNMKSGLINKMIKLILPFVETTVIRYVLGALYLGLNGLFSSVLSVLNLAELGFSSAIIYNMYKPIAENDKVKINQLLNLYRKVYRIVGTVILTAGLLLLPFLPRLIKGSYPEGINIYVVYVIFLLNSSVSFFLFSYMTSLLSAHQREDVNTSVNSVITILLYAAKIGIIIAFRNYYAAIVCMPVFTIVQNLVIAVRVKKLYPEYKCEGDLPAEELKPIRQLVMGTFISRVCRVTRNSLDNICTSMFIGLSLTAIYNNYYMIANSVTTLLGVVATSLVGGIGNHVATRSVDANFKELEQIDFVYMIISGWCTAFLLCLFQPFMTLWMGKDMLLSNTSVVLFCVYFYVLKMGDMKSMYSSTNGLWWHHRYRSLAETFGNISLNIILGKIFGVNGIIAATIISLFLCNFIWGVQITFGLYFKDKQYLRRFYEYQLKYAVINIFVCFLCFYACSLIRAENIFFILAINIVICTVIPAVSYYLLFGRSALFIQTKNKIMHSLK